jgi:exodeoxyribonuclease VII small subunit
VSEEQTFEDLQRALDELVARLERGDVPLDEALALYERGEAVHRALSERLDRAELRIEELRREGEPDPRDSGPSAG